MFRTLWNLEDYYSQFDNDVNVDFGDDQSLRDKIDSVVVPEHLQSYFMVFKNESCRVKHSLVLVICK